MSYHPRIEEVSDSDPEEMDIEELDSTPMTNNSIIEPRNIPSQASPTPAQMNAPKVIQAQPQDHERAKRWQVLYPLYFDSARSRADGRRVGMKHAIPNPLAREIVDAVQMLGLKTMFEPEKTHPKDWSNPGRVRILIREVGKNVTRHVKNKHDLYHQVADYLRAHPATENTPMRFRFAGMPPMSKPPAPPAIPKGWKMNAILPLHSAGLTGGGVSENFFKDMMAEMQGQVPGVEAPEAAKPKKDKKKIKS